MSNPDYTQMRSDIIEQIRIENQEVIDSMPDKPTTPGQELLAKEHGTPKDFATAAFNAVGSISCLEAHSSVQEYLARWNNA